MSLEVKKLITEKENSLSVAYTKFTLLSKQCPNDLFCFFENKDAPYYGPRIKQHYNGKLHYIPCGGKSQVLNIYKLINQLSEYKKIKKAYFIDRDFDKSIKGKHKYIYETPCYSIENLYCSEMTVGELLKTNFQISEEMPEYKSVMELYASHLNAFLDSSLLFNAWYRLQRIKQNKLNKPNNVSLTDTLIPKFISVTLTNVSGNYSITDLQTNYPLSFKVRTSSVNKMMLDLQAGDLRLDLRGKYVFSFMLKFIQLLIIDSSDKTKQTIFKQKIKCHIDNSMALTTLTNYAETPDCLIEFLKSYN